MKWKNTIILIIILILLSSISYIGYTYLDNNDKTEDKFLFSLNLEDRQYLKKGNISKELIKAFENNSIIISNESKVEDINNKKWEIRDGDKIYIIKDSGTDIDIYSQEISENMFDLPEEFNNQFVQFGIVLLGWAFATLIIIIILDRFFKKLAEKTHTDIDQKIIGILRTPIIIIIIVRGIISALTRLDLPGEYTTVFKFVYNICVILGCTWIAFRLFHNVVIYYGKILAKRTDTQLDDILMPVIEKMFMIIIPIIGLILLLQSLGINITVFIAGMGIFGIVLAFAAQETLSNFFSGLHILVDRPFLEGDLIQLDEGDVCEVKQIGMRSCKLYSIYENIMIIMPNTKLASGRIVNLTAPDIKIKIKIRIGVAYGTDIDKVQEILLDIAKKHPHVLKDTEDHHPFVLFTDFGDNSLNFMLGVWIDSVYSRGRIKSDIHSEIYKKFNAEGIEIPFPQRVVWMQK